MSDAVQAKLAQDNSRLAFVLMPFETEFNHIYSQLIKPALEDEGFEVRRADSTFDQQNILRTIVHNIDVADLIVAELTTSNPNVFYELGIAHGLNKPVVLLSQELEEVPFDLRTYNIITYSTRFNEVHELQNRLREIARRLKEGSVSFGNPVTDFAPRVSDFHSSAIVEFAPNTPETESVEDEEFEEDSGILDFVVEVENSIEDIASIVARLSETMEHFGQQTTDLTSEVQAVSGSGSPGSATQMRKIAGKIAAEIEELGNNIQAELPDFRDAWKRMEDNFKKLLSVAEMDNVKDRDQAITLLSHLDEFRQAIDPSLAGLQEARDAFAGGLGLSREMSVAVRKTRKVLDSLLEELHRGESSLTRMINLLDQKIPNISITQPIESAVVSDPVVIVGSGRTSEGDNVRLRVRDKDGTILAEGSVVAGTEPEIVPFETELSFSRQPQSPEGIVEAYATAGAGFEEDLVSVPIRFSVEPSAK